MCTVTDLDFDFVLWRLVQFTVCVVSALQYDALTTTMVQRSQLTCTNSIQCNKTSIIILVLIV